MASYGHPPEPGKNEGVATTAPGAGANHLVDPKFICCVCLDVLYKPVVICKIYFSFSFSFTLEQLDYAMLFKTHLPYTGAACGQMSCFWCVHRAMHMFQESNCAVCRRPYKHFPSICQLMHRLLLKLEPADYKRKEKEVLGERSKPQN